MWSRKQFLSPFLPIVIYIIHQGNIPLKLETLLGSSVSRPHTCIIIITTSRKSNWTYSECASNNRWFIIEFDHFLCYKIKWKLIFIMPYATICVFQTNIPVYDLSGRNSYMLYNGHNVFFSVSFLPKMWSRLPNFNISKLI